MAASGNGEAAILRPTVKPERDFSRLFSVASRGRGSRFLTRSWHRVDFLCPHKASCSSSFLLRPCRASSVRGSSKRERHSFLACGGARKPRKFGTHSSGASRRLNRPPHARRPWMKFARLRTTHPPQRGALGRKSRRGERRHRVCTARRRRFWGLPLSASPSVGHTGMHGGGGPTFRST